jgi:N-glycosylase/DNA lyase
MQRIDIVVGTDIQRVNLPDPESDWMPGFRWGDASLLLTPAWIAKHAHMRWRQGTYREMFGRRYNSLAEELVFCVLSGFGIKAEGASAAFQALKAEGIFNRPMTTEAIERVLRRPSNLEDGRSARYRFPKVRARYLYDALQQAAELSDIEDGLVLRDRLIGIRGIGPKTAAFVARNHLGCDRVAILDIHVLRAGSISRVFPSRYNLAKDYSALEALFLRFADAAAIPASILDMTIWEMMRSIPASRLEAANAANRALAAVEKLSVPKYDPSIDYDVIQGDKRSNGRERQQELPLWEQQTH